MSTTMTASGGALHCQYESRIPARASQGQGQSQQRSGWALGICLAVLAGGLALQARAQNAVGVEADSLPEATPSLSVDAARNMVRWGGRLPEAAGRKVEVRFSLYQEQAGGLALWNETQTINIGADGRYSVLLGVTTSEGLPQSIFDGDAARWVEARILKPGADPDTATQASLRTLLTAVPYAFKAMDSESLAGRAAAAYVTREDLQSAIATSIQSAALPEAGVVKPMLAGTGAYGSLAYWSDPTTLGVSTLSQSPSGNVVLRPTFVAPGGTGINSPVLEWSAANSSSPPLQFNFGWQAWGNGATASSGTLDFVTSYNNNPPLPTGLSIGTNGVINFAPGQQFPGTINAVTGGFGLNALNSSNSVSLSVDPTVIPTLSASNIFRGAENTFTRPIAFAPGQAFPGTASLNAENTFQADQDFKSSSGNGTAITATSEHGTAIIATGYSGGVFATASNDGSTGVGVHGNGPVGVAGYSAAGGVGVYGSSPGTVAANSFGSGTGVFGIGTTGVFGTGIQVGVLGQGQVGISGVGLGGIAVGVQGSSVAGWGVTGIAGGTSGVGLGFASDSFAGVWGDSYGKVASGLAGVDIAGVLGTADVLPAGYFMNNSSEKSTLYVKNVNTGGPSGLFKTLMATSPDGTCGFGGRGDMTCTGQVKTLAITGGGARKVETYAMQSAENWMEDFGSGEITNGVAIVTIDPAFAETVSDTVEYHVFLTPKGDSEGLYVTHETATGFEVRESGRGTSSLSFDYRIVAKRRGFESQRLTDVTDEFNRVDRPIPSIVQPTSQAAIAKQ